MAPTVSLSRSTQKLTFAARDDNFLDFAQQALELAYSNSEADVAGLLGAGLEDARFCLSSENRRKL